MRTVLFLALALLSAAPTIPSDPAPKRQFDFWIGEWSVLNRHMDGSGRWAEGDTTRARITPVCGGSAVLEEWAGPFRGTFQNGFSLRAWDPERERWTLLLFWTTTGHGSFGTMSGSFRHGRGEFVSNPGGRQRMRYTFSDALADTVRWDSSATSDGGVTWKTDWIMEFSRTRAADEVTQDNLFDVEWTTGKISPNPQARELDWMLGTWSGTQTADGVEREARLRCKLLNKDCLVLDLLETRSAGDEDWDEALTVRGFEQRTSAWGAWSVTETDTVLRRSQGRRTGERLSFVREEADGTVVEEYLIREGDDRMRIEVMRISPEGDEHEITTVLERAP